MPPQQAAEPVARQTPQPRPPQAEAPPDSRFEAQAPAAVAPVPQQPQPTREVIQVIKGMEKLGRGEPLEKVMPAKQFGTVGRKIALVANHFPITIPDGFLYHYDVDIVHVRKDPKLASAALPPKKGPPTGRKIIARICRQVMDKLISTSEVFRTHLPAYDGHKNIITRNPLAIKEATRFEVAILEEGDRVSNFQVIIKPVEKEDTGSCAINLEPLHAIMKGHRINFPQEAIMALDIVLRHGPTLSQVPIGRSFFTPPRNPNEAPYLGNGREVWFGYYQSLRPGQWKPMLNIDKSATTFYSAQSVLDFIGELINKNPNAIMILDVREIAQISKELRDVQIEVTHLTYPRKYKILRLTQERASRLQFKITKNGQEVATTVEQYFQDTYKKKLLFPNLPCIQVNPEAKKIFLPIEFCRITQGQHCRKKLTDRQTAEMIKFTATPPEQRFGDIQRSVKNTIDSSRSYLKEFGLTISPEPLKLAGRVIQPPNVMYQNEKTIGPFNGAWDLRDAKFFTGANITNWVLLNFSGGYCKEFNIQKFVEMLCKISREVGMTMDNPMAKLDLGRDRRSVGEIIRDVKVRYSGVTLAIIILGRMSNYSDIKHVAEIKEGLQTQCIKDENVIKKCTPQLISNLLQKINAKMEGVNCSLVPREKVSIFRRPVIIIGADVTHPAPGDKLKPSVAAAVGSMDSYPSRYAVSIRVQQNRDELQSRVEVILQLKEMVRELLMVFYRKTKYKPEKIIFYRDGVSEGQFLEVRESEVRQVRAACTSLEPDYQPQLTFVVVQKRHHTRFMPQNPRDGVGKCKNIPPGTTVDTDVVSPVDFDFFLCSHAGIQGTSRPAHYTVLWDDNNFTADELHKLTYHLCHTYVRCTRSISIPAPVMYAHLAAFRARQHIISATDISSSSSGSSDDSMEALSEDILNAVIVVQSLKERMYFV